MKNITKKLTAAILAIILVLSIAPAFADDGNYDGEEIIIEVDNSPEMVFKYNSYVETHRGCGGKILHRGDIFSCCVCQKCGEKHYWYSDFKVDVKVVPVYGPA